MCNPPASHPTMTEDELIEHLQTTPPACISGFSPLPTQLDKPFDDNPTSVWQLKCGCGGERGYFLGHSLSKWVEQKQGELDIFVGPLAIECSACDRVTELLDTEIHGYHADLAQREGEIDSVKYRGEGPRQRYACPGCGGEEFTTKAGFVFWYPDELLEEFSERYEDLFNVFLCHCTCTGCGKPSEPTQFGKL